MNDELFDAVRDIPTDILRKAALQMADPMSTLLHAYVDALESDSPARELDLLSSSLSKYGVKPEHLLVELTRTMSPQLSALTQQLASMQSGIQTISQAQESVVSELEGLGDSPEYKSALQDFANAGIDPDDLEALGKLELRLSALLKGVTSGQLPDPVKLQREADNVQTLLARLQTRDAVGELLERMRRLCEIADKHEERSAALWLGYARIADSLDGEHLVVPVYFQAFQRALTEKNLGIAQVAGRRIQGEATQKGDLTVVGKVAENLALLAKNLAEPAASVSHSLEAALVNVRQGDTKRAQQWMHEARTLSNDSITLQEMVAFSEGEVASLGGDDERAHQIWKELLARVTSAQVGGKTAVALADAARVSGDQALRRQYTDQALAFGWSAKNIRILQAAFSDSLVTCLECGQMDKAGDLIDGLTQRAEHDELAKALLQAVGPWWETRRQVAES